MYPLKKKTLSFHIMVQETEDANVLLRLSTFILAGRWKQKDDNVFIQVWVFMCVHVFICMYS